MESKFKPGDRVQYTGRAFRQLVGMGGTVKKTTSSMSVVVRFDAPNNEGNYTCMDQSLELVESAPAPPPTDGELAEIYHASLKASYDAEAELLKRGWAMSTATMGPSVGKFYKIVTEYL